MQHTATLLNIVITVVSWTWNSWTGATYILLQHTLTVYFVNVKHYKVAINKQLFNEVTKPFKVPVTLVVLI